MDVTKGQWMRMKGVGPMVQDEITVFSGGQALLGLYR